MKACKHVDGGREKGTPGIPGSGETPPLGLGRGNSGKLMWPLGQRRLTVQAEVTGTVAGIQVGTPALLTPIPGCWVRALTAPPVGAVEPTG